MPFRSSYHLIRHGVRSSSDHAAFFRFACVGLAMAAIDVGVLYLLMDLPGFNVYLARLVSYTSGLTVGYFLNRNFTFHHVESERRVLDELLRFFSVHVTGGLLNFGVFSLIVYLAEDAGLTRFWDAIMPLLGVWIGGVVGMCFNFLLSRKVVFDGATGIDE
jgi:putative flippase GtrA